MNIELTKFMRNQFELNLGYGMGDFFYFGQIGFFFFWMGQTRHVGGWQVVFIFTHCKLKELGSPTRSQESGEIQVKSLGT